MIIVIHGSLFSLFGYWKKPVKGGLGRSCQNDRFIAVNRLQNSSFPFPDGDKNWLQPENNPLITDLRIPELIQIPIKYCSTLYHPAYAPRFRPSGPVRRLPSDPHATSSVHRYAGRHLTTLNERNPRQWFSAFPLEKKTLRIDILESEMSHYRPPSHERGGQFSFRNGLSFSTGA